MITFLNKLLLGKGDLFLSDSTTKLNTITGYIVGRSTFSIMTWPAWPPVKSNIQVRLSSETTYIRDYRLHKSICFPQYHH